MAPPSSRLSHMDRLSRRHRIGQSARALSSVRVGDADRQRGLCPMHRCALLWNAPSRPARGLWCAGPQMCWWTHRPHQRIAQCHQLHRQCPSGDTLAGGCEALRLVESTHGAQALMGASLRGPQDKRAPGLPSDTALHPIPHPFGFVPTHTPPPQTCFAAGGGRGRGGGGAMA